MQEFLKRLSAPLPFASSYEAGLHAGLNGPDTENCHFRFFSTREASDDWSRGNSEGIEKRKRSAHEKTRW